MLQGSLVGRVKLVAVGALGVVGGAEASQALDTDIPNVTKDEVVQTCRALEMTTGIKYPIDERPSSFTSLSLLPSPTACV